MICNFPVPYPDEMLYSICARYSDRMQYSSARATARELIGHKRALSVKLPNKLGDLVAKLPPKHSYTIAKLIDNHTLLPFYQPFLPSDRIGILRGKMEGGGSNAMVYHLLGNNRIPWIESLRFCPACVKDDRDIFGECYWHRIHQIMGVEICPSHNTYLQTSSVNVDNRGNRYTFFSAEKTIERNLYPIIENARIDDNRLLRIAQDTLWLLQNVDVTIDLYSIQKKYLTLLAEKGLASYGGNVYRTKLLQAFQQYYTENFLNFLHCELGKSVYDNWLVFLSRNVNRLNHPLRHLLFISFLGYTVQAFFNLSLDRQYFGTGPWHCLNAVCTHYHQKNIQKFEISLAQTPDERPRGIFSCECGFIYSQVGPKSSEEDLFRASSIKRYGFLWEAKLRELWADSNISQNQIARVLGVRKATVRRQAKKMGLLFPRILYQTALTNEEHDERTIQVLNASNLVLRERYHLIWLSTIEENPGCGIKILQKKIPEISAVYSWLLSHDREWMKMNTPIYKRNLSRQYSHKPYADWKRRDEQFTINVREHAISMKNAESFPIRMTINAITNGVNQGNIIRRNLDKLPLTVQVMSEFKETPEAFALRRVQWIIVCYQREKVCPTRQQFIERVGVQSAQRSWSSVKNAINEAMQTLKEMT